MGNVLLMSDIPDVAERNKDRSFYAQNDLLRNNKKLCEIIPSGIWKGKRCFIVGGGPSLKKFDFSKLKYELIITVNRGLEFCPNSQINIAQDSRLFGWYEDGDLGQETKEKFEAYKGLKVWLNVQAFPFPEDIYVIGLVHPDDFDWDKLDYSSGIPPYGNSGLNALFLALCLSANPIYLLGFDLYGKEGKTANFHSGYPDKDRESIYKDNFLPDFEICAYKIKEKGIRVINLNPKSELRCFEFEDIDKIKPKLRKSNG